MFRHVSAITLAVALSLVSLVGASLGCSPPTTPDPPITKATITAISPNQGLAGLHMTVLISGTGFQTGAAVTLGDPVDDAVVSGTTRIWVRTPIHGVGRVDVVVTNPSGQSVRVVQGFEYGVVSLTASATHVEAGTQLGVNWVAPGRSNPGTDGDWIGLYRTGDPNSTPVAAQYTTGASGTLTFTAPIQPGTYEFRFLVDDAYVDFARTGPITVSSPSDR